MNNQLLKQFQSFIHWVPTAELKRNMVFIGKNGEKKIRPKEWKLKKKKKKERVRAKGIRARFRRKRLYKQLNLKAYQVQVTPPKGKEAKYHPSPPSKKK